MDASPPKAPLPPASRPPRLPVIALVLALIPGCPFVSMLGSLLGLMALGRMLRTGEQRRIRLARAACVVGWISTVVWGAAWWWGRSTIQDSNTDSIVRHIESVLDPDANASAAWLGTSPATKTLLELRTEVTARYGRIQRVSITSIAPVGSLTEPRQSVALVLFFEDERKVGNAMVAAIPGTIESRLIRLVIEDSDRGDLEIPNPPVED